MERSFNVLGFTFNDCTSYSQSNKERIPNTYSTERGNIRIVITCGHIDYRDQWIFSCYALGIEKVLIGKTTKENAAEFAIERCRKKAELIASLLN